MSCTVKSTSIVAYILASQHCCVLCVCIYVYMNPIHLCVFVHRMYACTFREFLVHVF